MRNAKPEDLEQVSRLLYASYGLHYVHGDFYRPRWIAEQIEAGRVLSSVALLDGKVVGHHALLSDQSGAALEIGVGVVDPVCRGLGIASRMFRYGIERARAAGTSALLSRSVTNHPYTQRAERAMGFRGTGLMLGAASPGFTGSPRRDAVLMAYLPFDRAPRPVSLPTCYSDPLSAAYAHLGIEIVRPDPDAGLAQLGGLPSVTTAGQGMTGAPGLAMITVGRWGEAERHELIDALRETVHHKEDVVYCDVDLHSLDAAVLEEIVTLLRSREFFYCGLSAFGRAGHDHLRMQAMLTGNVEWDRIVLDSDYARDLRRFAMADRDRSARS